MNVREQILNFLLQQCDMKDHEIDELKKQVTALQKQLAELEAPKTPSTQ